MNTSYKQYKGSYSGNVHELKEYGNFISSKTTYAENYHTDFHYHENPHLSMILQGGNLEHKGKVSSFKNTGEVLFYHSGEIHSTVPTHTSTKNLNFEIEASFLSENSLDETALEIAVANPMSSRFFMLKMYKELLLDDSFTDSAVQMLLLDFIYYAGHVQTKMPLWCLHLKELLNDEWDKSHNLAELSLALGVHPVNISKHFRRYFGYTYGEYMRCLKINNSLGLIKNSGHTLTEIAFICGFADQSHFIRVFKACTGINPKAFRRI